MIANENVTINTWERTSNRQQDDIQVFSLNWDAGRKDLFAV